VLWTDESSFQLFSGAEQYVWRRERSSRRREPYGVGVLSSFRSGSIETGGGLYRRSGLQANPRAQGHAGAQGFN